MDGIIRMETGAWICQWKRQRQRECMRRLTRDLEAEFAFASDFSDVSCVRMAQYLLSHASAVVARHFHHERTSCVANTHTHDSNM